MIRRDYREEVGLKPATKEVPLPLALIILAAAAGLLWWAVAKTHSASVVDTSPQTELTIHR